jgi:hypothetical protein
VKTEDNKRERDRSVRKEKGMGEVRHYIYGWRDMEEKEHNLVRGFPGFALSSF